MDIDEIRRAADALELSNTGAYYRDALRALLLMYDDLEMEMESIIALAEEIARYT